MGISLENTRFCMKMNTKKDSCLKCEWWATLTNCQKLNCDNDKSSCLETFCSLKTYGKFGIVLLILFTLGAIIFGLFKCCSTNKSECATDEEKIPLNNKAFSE